MSDTYRFSGMGEPIQVALGLAAESGCLMQFTLYDNGAHIYSGHTPEELLIATAVLRDLADALEQRSRDLTN